MNGVTHYQGSRGSMEIWRDIPDFEGLYQASTLGRIRNADHRVLRPFCDKYFQITLCKDGVRNRRFIHDLVLTTFSGPRPDGFQGAHGVLGQLNNSIQNLAWKSAKDNAADKIEHGTYLFGSRHHNSKLSESEVAEIRAASGPQHLIAERFGISQTNVSLIRRGKGWSHVA